MNTKAAVILMIGLLGSPVAYNFTQPVWEGTSTDSISVMFNRRTGEWFSVWGAERGGATSSSVIPPRFLGR